MLVSKTMTVFSLVWLTGVFPKWKRNSVNSANSGNQINHRNMNWAQFKDPVSHMCLAGAVVASWSLTPRGGWVAGLIPFTVMTNIFVTEFREFIENIQENSTVPVTHLVINHSSTGAGRLTRAV